MSIIHLSVVPQEPWTLSALNLVSPDGGRCCSCHYNPIYLMPVHLERGVAVIVSDVNGSSAVLPAE